MLTVTPVSNENNKAGLLRPQSFSICSIRQNDIIINKIAMNVAHRTRIWLSIISSYGANPPATSAVTTSSANLNSFSTRLRANLERVRRQSQPESVNPQAQRKVRKQGRATSLNQLRSPTRVNTARLQETQQHCPLCIRRRACVVVIKT